MSIATIVGFADYNSDDTDRAYNSHSNTITVHLKDLKHIGKVDERYQSYNIEMVEVVGGRFWKPYYLMDSLPSRGFIIL